MTKTGLEHFKHDVQEALKNSADGDVAAEVETLASKYQECEDYGRCYACDRYIEDTHIEQCKCDNEA